MTRRMGQHTGVTGASLWLEESPALCRQAFACCSDLEAIIVGQLKPVVSALGRTTEPAASQKLRGSGQVLWGTPQLQPGLTYQQHAGV